MKWTPEKVREELPTVKVKDERGIWHGAISGRLNKFATVTYDNGRRIEVAWETLANCLNSNKPVLY